MLVLLAPLVISPGTFAHFSVSKALYTRVLIEIAFVAWVFLAVRNPEFRLPRSRVILAFSLYVLASLLAAVWGVNAMHSFWSSYDRMTGVVDLIHWLLFTLVLVSVVRMPRNWRVLFNWQLGVTLVLSVIAITQAYGLSLIPSVVAKCRVDATLGNPSFLAPILIVSILVATGLLLRSLLMLEDEEGPQSVGKTRNAAIVSATAVPGSTIAMRAFWIAVMVVGLYVLVLTGTRGALVGLVSGVLVMPAALLIWGNRRALKPVALGAVGILLTVGALFAIDHTVGLGTAVCADHTATNRLTDLASAGTADGSLENRLAAIQAGLRGFAHRPLLGWGPENFGYAFDRHVDAWIFKHGSFVQDKAHNQVVEELTTKGVVGAAAFLFLWATLVWVVVSRKRPAEDDVLAYALLGALGAYFVQNLFLFDTPSTLLVWLLLLGWVATQERSEVKNSLRQGGDVRRGLAGRLLTGVREIVPSTLLSPRGQVIGAVILVAALGVSIYSFSLQPYLAARAFGQASQHGVPTAQRLVLAEQSFETFPPMANQPRQLMILQIVRLWEFLDDAERRQVTQFFGREASTALKDDPHNAPLLITAILFLQSTAQSPEVLASVGPLLQQLYVIAPNRAETHQLLANQALKQGRYDDALRIAREYQSQAPGTEWFFAGIENAAQEGLATRVD